MTMGPTAPAALLRIGWRNARRSPWRSLLVVVLILLPVAAMVGGSAVLKTTTPTPDRLVTQGMGAADLLVYAGPDGSGALLRSLLPAGSTVEPFFSTSGTLQLPGMEVSSRVMSHDPEGLGHGFLTLVEGRLPAAAGEAAISSEVGRLAKAHLGGEIEVEGFGALHVVGLVEDELNLRARIVFLGPGPAQTAEATSGDVGWLVGLPAGTDPATLDFASPIHVDGQPPAHMTEPAFIVITRAEEVARRSEVGPAMIVLGGLALVNAALVAAAAFAVGVRRRQRELGLLAAAGGEPRHLAGTVLAEALLLGGLGAIGGVAAGLAAALAASPFLDGLTGHRNPAITPDVALLLVAVAMGVVTAVVASLVPAWSAGRLPVLVALSGRRPPASSGRTGLVAGLSLVVFAAGLTALGAALRFDEAGGWASTPLLLGGAVLGTLGFGACSPWLLGRLERPGLRLPVAGRIAFRDLARARSRNGPLVTALLAAFAATVALAAYLSSLEASQAARFRPSLFADQLVIAGPGFAQAGPEAARELGAVAAGQLVAAIGDDADAWVSPGEGDDQHHMLATGWVVVASPELVRALGVEGASADLEAGKVVLLAESDASVTSATIHLVSQADGSEVRRAVLPARLFVTGLVGDELPGALISPETAASLGLRAGEGWRSDQFLVRLPHPVTDTDLGRAASIAAAYPDTTVRASRPPEVAGAAFRAAMIAASIVFALSVTAIAVALGEAESRPDQRVLLAIGADPRVRRRIAAARAGAISLVGGALAVPAGLLPVWGLLASQQAPLVAPWPEIVASLAILPLLAVVGTWALSRPIPAWQAFRGPSS
jgi:putative ABC transport system permease protein